MTERERFCQAEGCMAISDDLWNEVQDIWIDLGNTDAFWDWYFEAYPEVLNGRSEYSGYSEACGYWT